LKEKPRETTNKLWSSFGEVTAKTAVPINKYKPTSVRLGEAILITGLSLYHDRPLFRDYRNGETDASFASVASTVRHGFFSTNLGAVTRPSRNNARARARLWSLSFSLLCFSFPRLKTEREIIAIEVCTRRGTIVSACWRLVTTHPSLARDQRSR